MKVVISGAGRVGGTIARELAREGNAVCVIDQSAELAQALSETADVQAITGHGAYPAVLARAGARDADMLIAVTGSDEVNMVAAQIARTVFEVPLTVARIRRGGYLEAPWSDLFNRHNLSIDVIISPEFEVAKHVVRRLRNPGATEAFAFADGRAELVGVRLVSDTPAVATPLEQLIELFPDLRMRVVGVVREGRVFTPALSDQLAVGDLVYFVADTEHVRRTLELMGHSEAEARRIVIVGAGNIGLAVAQSLEAQPGFRLKLIEADKAQAESAAETLRRTLVLHGDGLDRNLLREAGVFEAETALALTNSDEVNILTSVLALTEGAARSIALVTKRDYQGVVDRLGLDAFIDPREVTVSSILQHVRKGRIKSLFSIEDGAAEVIEAVALDTSPLTGKALGHVERPNGVSIGAVVRNDAFHTPDPELVIQAGDRVIVLAERGRIREVERLFRVSLQYF